MKTFNFLLCCALFAGCTAYAADNTDAQTIAGKVMVDGHSMQYLQELTDQFGGRLTGSEEYDAAAKWAADQFRAMGIKDVRLEPFTIPHTWKRGTSSGRITAPYQRPLHIEALGWSVGTPSGGIKGQITVVGDLHPDAMQKQAAEIRDHIVLLDLSKIFGGENRSYKNWSLFQDAPAILQKLGAKGILSGARRPEQVLSTTGLDWNADVTTIPMAMIGMEDAAFIMRVAKEKPVSVEYQYNVEIGGPKQVNNIVAEIRGSEKPDEFVLLGAHFDSWDFATGAQDNGSGTAEVMEAARVLASLKTPPKRSIRFALWGGEEEGIIGSRAYVKEHAAEVEKCVANLNSDNGAGEVKGWLVEGDEAAVKGMEPIAKSLDGFGAGKVEKEIDFDTDDGPFLLAGVPAYELHVDMSGYGAIHHTAGDTLDKVEAKNLATASAVMALAAYHIAQDPNPVAPHLDHAAIAALLKDKDLGEFLLHTGLWK